jgi:hypothetical protein
MENVLMCEKAIFLMFRRFPRIHAGNVKQKYRGGSKKRKRMASWPESKTKKCNH